MEGVTDNPWDSSDSENSEDSNSEEEKDEEEGSHFFSI
jgi:hypothetical protein